MVGKTVSMCVAWTVFYWLFCNFFSFEMRWITLIYSALVDCAGDSAVKLNILKV